MTELELTTPIRLDLSPGAHPNTVKGDTSGPVIVREAMTALYETAGKISDTGKAVEDRASLANAARPVAERTLNMAGSVIERVEKQIANLDSQINDAITPQRSDDTTADAEIRQYWANKKSNLGDLSKVMASDDARTIRAVLNVPPYLSGLTPDQQSVLRIHAAKHHAPDLVREREESVSALTSLKKAATAFSNDVSAKIRAWRDSDDRAQIEAGLK